MVEYNPLVLPILGKLTFIMFFIFFFTVFFCGEAVGAEETTRATVGKTQIEEVATPQSRGVR